MSNNPQISAAGSSTYDSSTLHVGDGTWDASRDDFLLPPLVGLNFATMQYNGMGNRFREFSGYHSLVKGHAILAAIAFLLVVPSAIFTARFGWANPRTALRLHIWLQILTVFLATVVLVLGYFAVGPRRSLSNPHHGIGVAIYVLVLFQAIWGSIVRSLEKGRVIWKISVKLMLHQWIGRATALLAIAQVPLGLTLYGSPKILFILYALWVALLVVLWFILTHRYQPGAADDGTISYISGGATEITARSSRRHGGGALKAVAAGGLTAALLSRFTRGKQNKMHQDQTDASSSHHRSNLSRSHLSQSLHSQSRNPRSGPSRSRHSPASSLDNTSYTDEKSDMGQQSRQHTLSNKLLTVLGVTAVVGAVRGIFSNRKTQQTERSGYSYHSGTYSDSRTDFSQMEEGRAYGAATPGPGRQRASHLHTDERTEDTSSVAAPAAVFNTPSKHGRPQLRKSGGSLPSEDETSLYSPGQEKRNSHTARNTISTLGFAGFLKHKFGQRRNRKEEERVEQIKKQDHMQEERMLRQQSRRQNDQQDRWQGSRTGRHTNNGRIGRRQSLTASEISPLAGSTPALSRPYVRPRPATSTVSSHSRTPAGRANLANNQTNPNNSRHSATDGGLHRRLDSSDTEAYFSRTTSQRHTRHKAQTHSSAPPDRLHTSVNSPPLSIKMRMKTDKGRQHVTLQRISPSEAAVERRAARQDRRTRTDSSIGTSSNIAEERWRRTEALEKAQDAEMCTSAQLPAETHHTIAGPAAAPYPGQSMTTAYYENLAPPPPVTDNGIFGTSESTPESRADSNRRRRRAERARADQAGRAGSRVEFS